MSKDLVTIEKSNVIALISAGGLDPLIEKVRVAAMAHVPILETEKSRKAIASNAYKVSLSKTSVTKIANAQIADDKAKVKKFVSEVKRFERELDTIRDDARKPLDEWEVAEKVRQEDELLQLSWAEAIIENARMDDLIKREAALKKREAELQAQEDERVAKETAEREAEEAKAEKERLEKERIAREEQIKKEAAEAAKLETEQKAKAELDRVEREKQEAIDAAEKAKQDKIDAEKKAAADKIEAEAKAKAAQEAAVKAVKEQADRDAAEKERKRLADEKAEKAKADKLAANKAHMGKVDREALAEFVNAGFSKADGKKIVSLVAEGLIKHVTVNY